MKNDQHIFLNLYDNYLSTIKDIKFTHREIDIITSVIHMRGASKIALLLSISTRTVETHTANIMRKMDVNSREGIIDFVGKAGCSPWIHKHYRNLLIHADFKKRLREISKLIHNKHFFCFIVYEDDQEEKQDFILILKDHFALCGIKTVLQEIGHEKLPGNSLLAKELPPLSHIIYKIPRRLIGDFQADPIKQTPEVSHLMHGVSLHFPSLTFLCTYGNNTIFSQDLKKISFVGEKECQNYFSLFFNILKRILADINFDEIVLEFFENLQQISEKTLLPLPPRSGKMQERGKIISNKKIWALRTSVVVAIVISLGFGFSLERNNSHFQSNTKPALSIRNDLVVPTKNTFLDRPNIICKLKESLERNDGIQAVALVGVGGAGKTTIARKYALTQNAGVVWEVNAATRETLRDSFQNLSYALCKSEEEKKVLDGLKKIENKIERDERILLFVKERLKNISNWFLIYDNLEKFSGVQKYFPCDSRAWGNGKIIVTTSDDNSKNNNLIQTFIQIGELSPQEKLSLFTKIMVNEGSSFPLTPFQQQEANNFLNDIPPFPLDVLIAAYYLKSTSISYVKYLEYLKENNEAFENIQNNVVQEVSDYTKTRYKIITLSLKQLINIHKDFGGLLVLVSLLNSQNIPRDLLVKYKSDTIVDNFIYHLKKYSLITSESSSDLISVFSIHRNTQKISLGYLVKALDLTKNSSLLHSLVITLEDYIVGAVDKEDFARMKLLVSHCETFCNYDNLITQVMKSSIGGALGCIYYYLRHNHNAKQLLEENLISLSQHEGENHVRIARILTYLGNFYRAQGDCEKAKSLLERGLMIYKKDPYDIRNAKPLGYLGAVYRDLGDYKKAKVLFERSLLLYEKHSENHIGHAWVLAHLGSIHMIFGDYQKAKLFLERSLIIYKQQSEDYVGVSWVLRRLGAIYNLLGNCDKAKDLLQQSLSITRKYFADGHIFVASGLSFLGAAHTQTGNYQQAKSLLHESLAVYEKNYGKNHIETARVLRMLGEAYCVEGDLETAEDLINKSLLVFQQKEYPEAYSSLESLADLYRKKALQATVEDEFKQAQSFNSQSLTYLKQALIITKDYFPEDSQHILRIQNKIINSHVK